MALVEMLEKVGFADKSVKIDVIPQINNAPDGQNKRTEGKVLRRGDPRTVGVYRSLLFRRPGSDVIVYTRLRDIWTPEQMKAGRPIKLKPYGYEGRPDEEIGDLSFAAVMDVLQ